MRNKFFIIILGFLLALFIGAAIWYSLSKPGNNQNNQNGQLPEYFLSAEEEQTVRQFVKNFVNLYNTYSYEDFSNLMALGDYQTVQMQDRTGSLVANLEKTVKEGYNLTTQADEKTFSYRYPKVNQLLVEIKGQANENGITYNTKAKLELLRQNNHWLVNNIEINKN